jgi:hypothetical protein
MTPEEGVAPMTDRLRRKALSGALVLLCLAAAAPAAALAAPVGVTVRVEGASKTILEVPVTSDGHEVTTPSGGSHQCDGTNNGAYPSPVPTPTAALDDATRANGVTWDADWFPDFEDFIVTRVADESATSTQFWGLLVNGKFSNSGGCQVQLKQGDEALYAFDAFSKTAVLRLAGPDTATVGQPINVTVSDTQSETPAANASVGGATTGADGVATVAFNQKGIYRLKAERSDAIRSNALVVCADPAGAAPCTSTDTTAPSVESGFGGSDPDLPGRRLASRNGRSRTMLVSWGAQDGAGSGVAFYSVEVSKAGDGAGGSQVEPEWRTLLDKAPTNSLHFRGESGDAYRFRITATDRALNSASIVTDPVLIPVDDRDRGLLRLSRGWKRTRQANAWGRTVVRAKRAGATARMRFRGTQLALIGRKVATGGHLRVTVDGRSRTLRVRGHTRPRSVLWVSRKLDAGAHVLRLRSLDGGPVELDAVAPSP